MSITKGAMLISNANAVGSELVNKLGGTGYKPVEWADAINLLGISNDDKASALASITEGTYTGDERGSIKYNNCNAVGSMLNKKFSTDRGFKPVEWESAISKLTPLAERTVSGSIAHITDGADTVPIKSWEVEIAPTLSGKSAIECTQTGKNLFDISTATNGQINGTNGVYYANANWQASDFFPVHGANLTLSWDTDSSNYYQVNLAFYDSEEHYVDGSSNTFANIYSKTFTIPNGAVYCRASWSISVGGSPAPRNNIRINLGSTDRGYTPYTSPTQYNVNLGRTIYGGTADVVNGTGTEKYKKITLSSLLTNLSIAQIGTTGVYRIRFDLSDAKAPLNSQVFSGLCDYYTSLPANQTYNQNEGISISAVGQCFIYDIRFNASTSLNDFKTWIDSNPVNLVYELATATDFTFTPITPTPETALGVNNFWADEGDSEVTYRKDPDIPDPPVQVINMNNNENNDN